MGFYQNFDAAIDNDLRRHLAEENEQDQEPDIFDLADDAYDRAGEKDHEQKGGAE